MISFIIPVYKPKEKLLTACIKAIREQSLKNVEVIFVLDGPDRDAERVISRELKHIDPSKQSDWVVHVRPENEGACSARNFGFSQSKGDIVVFWDADCIIEPNTARNWIDVFEKNKDVDFIYSGYRFLEEKGVSPQSLLIPGH